jgi:hypothetical protein
MRILQPLLVLVRIRIPELAAESAEVGGVCVAADEAEQLCHDCREVHLLGGQDWKALRQVELHHAARDHEGVNAGAVLCRVPRYEVGRELLS